MRIQISQISVPLVYDDSLVLKRVSRKVGCPPKALTNVKVTRRSLDTRPRNPEPRYVLMAVADLNMDRLPPKAHRDVKTLPALRDLPEPKRALSSAGPRPIVVGAGPAGLMAAYELAVSGCRPILVERGDAAKPRAKKVAAFWNRGELDSESNTLYGEGGAGLFSDGKLTARSKERGRIQQFFEILVECGAKQDILMDASPHIGSDELLKIVPRLREKIIELGGEVRFGHRLERLIIQHDQLRAVVINGEEIECTDCFLAVGHSARDTYAMLSEVGVSLEAKPFAIGIRLEVPQIQIDRAQYGKFAGNDCLGAASFRLSRKGGRDIRSCYSFCMCPGGRVISCSSEPDMLTTNGMSYSSRAMKMANAAFLVPVTEADFPIGDIPILSGVDFQREIERRAFTFGGSDYGVPAVLLKDFLKEQTSSAFPDGISCTRIKTAEFREILPDFVTQTLATSVVPMLKELNGVRPDEAVIYAAETRSSSPIRIIRGDNGQSLNVCGLYPVGEGAGYAGGIVSSAVDGIRAADAYLS